MQITRRFINRLLLLLFLWGTASLAHAQETVISFGKNRLPITEYFTITVKLRSPQVYKDTIDFPGIEGFKKSNKSRSRVRITTGNKTIIEETFTQNYAAYQEGIFILPPFSILINSKKVSSKGTTIIIEPPAEPGNEPKPGAVTPIVSGKNIGKGASFLVLETDKRGVFVGESVQIRLFFYLAETEQGLLDFYDFGPQFSRITKQLKQQQVWEEPTDVTGATPDTLKIKDKKYIRFKLFESLYFSLNNQPLIFPDITLIMAQRPPTEYSETPAPTELVAFTAIGKRLEVKSLPPHPLRESVPVGQFRLQEGISQTQFSTNKSFIYNFIVTGVGNFSPVMMPEKPTESGIEVFPPGINQRTQKSNGQVSGFKRFSYTLVPNTPGSYNLGKLFRLIYFDPSRQVYDTLQSELEINVTGSEDKVAALVPEETDPFYKLIREEKNTLVSLTTFEDVKLYTNLVILLLICVSFYLFIKK